MSQRTAKACKAIYNAWVNEVELVNEGKGTRDWTEEQQLDIIVKGKAYDDDGRAFEGHHMKSVEQYPDYQENPQNIEFLTRNEHIEAHGGNFQNPTNGYYNPYTNETMEFCGEELTGCRIIELSNPISATARQKRDERKAEEQARKIENENRHDGGRKSSVNLNKPEEFAFDRGWKRVFKNVTNKIKTAFHSTKDVIVENPEVFETFARTAVKVGTQIVVAKQADKIISRTLSGMTETHLDETKVQILNNSSMESQPSMRQSPIEHVVKLYTRRQNGKDVTVKSYPRGVKK